MGKFPRIARGVRVEYEFTRCVGRLRLGAAAWRRRSISRPVTLALRADDDARVDGPRDLDPLLTSGPVHFRPRRLRSAAKYAAGGILGICCRAAQLSRAPVNLSVRFRRRSTWGGAPRGPAMCGLLTIVKKLRAAEKEMRVLIIGLDCAGKSSCVNRLRGEDVHSVAPTQGFDIVSLRHASGYTLNLWDVGGQQTIRAYWRNYFEATDAIVWVVDSADAARMADCRRELETVLQEERLAGATLLVLANKQDLAGSLGPDSIASFLGLNDAVGRKRHWQVFPCSAVSCAGRADGDGGGGGGGRGERASVSGLEAGFDWLVADVASRMYAFD